MTESRIEHFNLTASGISREEFDSFERLVYDARNTRRQGVQHDSVKLWMVTDQVSDLETRHRNDAEKKIRRGTVGICWKSGLVWIDPRQGEKWDVPDHIEKMIAEERRRTLIHELSHAYVRSQSHGPGWRYVYGTALAAWTRSLGKDEQNVRYDVRNYCVARYMQWRRWTPQGLPNYYDEYQDKVYEEVTKLCRKAERIEYACP